MLTITIPPVESFNNETQEFITIDGATIEMEHSLLSLHRWESKWEKPFLGPDNKTTEETFDYIRCMCLDPEIPIETIRNLSEDLLAKVNAYIESKMTATWFRDEPSNKPAGREIITADIIYYWMISLNVPLEWETRHLNQLFTLLRTINQKNQPKKKMSSRDLAARNRQLNAERKAQLKTAG